MSKCWINKKWFQNFRRSPVNSHLWEICGLHRCYPYNFDFENIWRNIIKVHWGLECVASRSSTVDEAALLLRLFSSSIAQWTVVMLLPFSLRRKLCLWLCGPLHSLAAPLHFLWLVDQPLEWLRCFLTDRSNCVVFDLSRSLWVRTPFLGSPKVLSWARCYIFFILLMSAACWRLRGFCTNYLPMMCKPTSTLIHRMQWIYCESDVSDSGCHLFLDGL